MLEIRLLGKFDLRQAGKSIAIPSRPAQSLLAYLILTAGTPHRREKLAGLLWPDSLEETARDNLRHALWRVRKALRADSVPCNLKANDLTISFDVLCEYWFDVAVLVRLNGTESADELIAVLSGYKGELLPGFYEEWVVLEREHLNSIFEHNMARLMSLLQDENRWLDILDWGERWIKLGQKPEPAYRALMSAHVAKGDMSKVVVTYERCVKSLKELGVEPSEQTRALYEMLITGMGNPETGSVAPKKETRIESPKMNLPTPLTSFIGREKEVEEVQSFLEKHRLVTLTGPGGVGKTRLAIQSSNRVSTNFNDGVWWVELAPLVDKALVLQAVAQSLGVQESPTQPLTKSLKTFLRKKQMLLVLDNCEHLIDACAQLAHDLLTQCANLRILATSREALDIMGEFEYPVQPLSLPALEHLTFVDILLDYEGIRLFVERAHAKSGFTLTEQNASPALQICQRLDGIPLAIELAAARTRTLTVEQIAEWLNDRFNLLTQGNRTALPRHQTLRASIDWSFDLLSGEEQILFRRLAVFAGGWTLDEAQAVCSDDGIEVNRVFDLLSLLVDKSLIIAQELDKNIRYQMLETIRQYAYEKFFATQNSEQLKDRHLGFFMEFAEEAEQHTFSTRAPAWMERIKVDWENFRSAIQWSLERDYGEKGLRIASALGFYAHALGYLHDLYQTMLELLKSQGSERRTLTLGKGLFITAAVGNELGNLQDVRIHYEKSIEILRETGMEGRGILEMALGYFAYALLWSEPRKAARYAKEAVDLCHTSGNRNGLAVALARLAEARFWMNDIESARALLKESAVLAQEIGNQFIYLVSITDLGIVEFADGNLDAAKQHFDLFNNPVFKSYKIWPAVSNTFFGAIARVQGQKEVSKTLLEEAIQILQELGDKRWTATALVFLGRLELEQGNRKSAETYFRQAIILAFEANALLYVSWSLESFAYLCLASNQPRRAIKFLGAADVFREKLGAPILTFERQEYESNLLFAHAQLDQTSFDATWAEGRAMSIEQAIDFAQAYQITR